MDTNRKTKLMKLNVFITIIALAISLTSLFYVTYSWFVFERSANTAGPKISIDQGLEYNLKYFTHNLNGGYPKKGHEPVDIVATSYANEFVNVWEDFHEPEEYSLIEEPGYRVTFALEITSLPSGADHEVTFTLNDFISPPHEDFYRYNSGVTEEIHLCEAINIYTETVVLTSSDNDTTITGYVNDFISNETPSDKFDFDHQNTPPPTVLLDTSPLVDASSADTSLIFFFTIEFSATSDTFYKFREIDNGNVLFDKDVTGNSNVYKGLAFTILEIVVRKEYVL